MFNIKEKDLTPIEGRDVAAFAGRPNPFLSREAFLFSPQMTGARITPLLTSSVRNLSAKSH